MVAGAGKADLYGEDGGNGAGDVGESIASLLEGMQNPLSPYVNS